MVAKNYMLAYAQAMIKEAIKFTTTQRHPLAYVVIHGV